MGNRCNDCNKFVALEPGEPEVDLDVSGTEVQAHVRIALCCAECGSEIRAYEDDLAEDLPDLEEHTKGEECSLEVDENGVDLLDETEKRRRVFGVRAAYEVKCACSHGMTLHEGSLESSKVAASEMEEC